MALVLAHPQPGTIARAGGVECPRCSEFFGFLFRPTVSIKPQRALRLSTGTIVIENPTVVCAICADRGVETIL